MPNSRRKPSRSQRSKREHQHHVRAGRTELPGFAGYCRRKIRFIDEAAAAAALEAAQAKRERENAAVRECRYYECDDCMGWHLTSRPER